MKRQLLCILSVILSMLMTQPASAATECTINILRIWVGEDGNLFFVYTNGGSAYILPNDPDRQGTLAMMMTAQVAQRQATVRYQADGVACTSASRTDIVGVWLH